MSSMIIDRRFIEYKIELIDKYIKNYSFSQMIKDEEELLLIKKHFIIEKDIWERILETEGSYNFNNDEMWLFYNIEKATCQHEYEKHIYKQDTSESVTTDNCYRQDIFQICKLCGHVNDLQHYNCEQQILEFDFKPVSCSNCKFYKNRKCSKAGISMENKEGRIQLAEHGQCHDWKGVALKNYDDYLSYQDKIREAYYSVKQ